MSQDTSVEGPEAGPEPVPEPPDARPADGPPGGHGAPAGGGTVAQGAISEAFGSLVAALLRRGRSELGRRASTGRVRLDLRMLRRDRDQMYQKLGREVRALIEGGEVTHPGLRRGVTRIEELEARIAAVEAELAAAGPEGAGVEGDAQGAVSEGEGETSEE